MHDNVMLLTDVPGPGWKAGVWVAHSLRWEHAHAAKAATHPKVRASQDRRAAAAAVAALRLWRRLGCVPHVFLLLRLILLLLLLLWLPLLWLLLLLLMVLLVRDLSLFCQRRQLLHGATPARSHDAAPAARVCLTDHHLQAAAAACWRCCCCRVCCRIRCWWRCCCRLCCCLCRSRHLLFLL
jgi:hypothetical protein